MQSDETFPELPPPELSPDAPPAEQPPPSLPPPEPPPSLPLEPPSEPPSANCCSEENGRVLASRPSLQPTPTPFGGLARRASPTPLPSSELQPSLPSQRASCCSDPLPPSEPQPSEVPSAETSPELFSSSDVSDDAPAERFAESMPEGASHVFSVVTDTVMDPESEDPAKDEEYTADLESALKWLAEAECAEELLVPTSVDEVMVLTPQALSMTGIPGLGRDFSDDHRHSRDCRTSCCDRERSRENRSATTGKSRSLSPPRIDADDEYDPVGDSPRASAASCSAVSSSSSPAYGSGTRRSESGENLLEHE
mmetsp:Transcript_29508/g.90454  ORF Transcript_29508/g.90454 Transcript_29508/m.90454 type:complete len:310 (+) Transcript_29508:1653-2582(+)|eukprot:scaffold72150_cov26-Tisochrysis_lutea.AAC.3